MPKNNNKRNRDSFSPINSDSHQSKTCNKKCKSSAVEILLSADSKQQQQKSKLPLSENEKKLANLLADPYPEYHPFMTTEAFPANLINEYKKAIQIKLRKVQFQHLELIYRKEKEIQLKNSFFDLFKDLLKATGFITPKLKLIKSFFIGLDEAHVNDIDYINLMNAQQLRWKQRGVLEYYIKQILDTIENTSSQPNGSAFLTNCMTKLKTGNIPLTAPLDKLPTPNVIGNGELANNSFKPASNTNNIVSTARNDVFSTPLTASTAVATFGVFNGETASDTPSTPEQEFETWLNTVIIDPEQSPSSNSI